MIDFETTIVAIPFYRGARPYEPVAFQFSHHVIHEDGRIEHADEYIERQVGKFPNFDFLRALKKALEKDNGTIFRYAAHENSILNSIIEQLEDGERYVPGESLHDRRELIEWTKTITVKKASDGKYIWQGERAMVDLLDLVKRFFFDPYTGGSNSIKYVLPAILRRSALLQKKYTQKIYGASKSTPGAVTSKNFRDHAWVQFDGDGNVRDPYKILPPVFSPDEEAELERLYPDVEIREGASAALAYAKMQFTEMTDDEREKLIAALLKYCELDTFGMVLLYEYWRDEVSRT